MKRFFALMGIAMSLWGCGAEPRVEDLRVMTRPNQASYMICAPTFCAATADEQGPVLDMPVERALAAARRAVARQANLAAIREDPAINQFVTVQYSQVLRFPDLVRIQAIPAANGKVALALYSQSIYGYYDFGANRKRARAWMEAINAELKRG